MVLLKYCKVSTSECIPAEIIKYGDQLECIPPEIIKYGDQLECIPPEIMKYEDQYCEKNFILFSLVGETKIN